MKVSPVTDHCRATCSDIYCMCFSVSAQAPATHIGHTGLLTVGSSCFVLLCMSITSCAVKLALTGLFTHRHWRHRPLQQYSTAAGALLLPVTTGHRAHATAKFELPGFEFRWLQDSQHQDSPTGPSPQQQRPKQLPQQQILAAAAPQRSRQMPLLWSLPGSTLTHSQHLRMALLPW